MTIAWKDKSCIIEDDIQLCALDVHADWSVNAAPTSDYQLASAFINSYVAAGLKAINTSGTSPDVRIARAPKFI